MTRVRHDRYKCNTTVTRATQVQHECDTNDMIATRVQYFGFDKDTSENKFLHPYISYMTNDRLQGEVEFHSKNYLLDMPPFYVKIHLKSVPQKLNFVMANPYQKVTHLIVAANTLARSRIVTHSNAALLSMKTIFCETNNSLISKNY